MRTVSVRGSHHFGQIHIDAAAALIKSHPAIGKREDREVLAKTDIAARFPFGAALAGNDVAGDHDLATIFLDAEPLAL